MAAGGGATGRRSPVPVAVANRRPPPAARALAKNHRLRRFPRDADRRRCDTLSDLTHRRRSGRDSRGPGADGARAAAGGRGSAGASDRRALYNLKQLINTTIGYSKYDYPNGAIISECRACASDNTGAGPFRLLGFRIGNWVVCRGHGHSAYAPAAVVQMRVPTVQFCAYVYGVDSSPDRLERKLRTGSTAPAAVRAGPRRPRPAAPRPVLRRYNSRYAVFNAACVACARAVLHPPSSHVCLILCSATTRRALRSAHTAAIVYCLKTLLFKTDARAPGVSIVTQGAPHRLTPKIHKLTTRGLNLITAYISFYLTLRPPADLLTEATAAAGN
ncbi:hypothetical protein EVAR_20768_1 [Eumeta japonica]|uniref:Uncharacterized protein n=1 Tax=Eumeta variegata TaxID=151549 RepID=A0A4C1VCQ1_EUMVA|nr:hypothetical protein EVAR_20768_1 [Eumeta japonica]